MVMQMWEQHKEVDQTQRTILVALCAVLLGLAYFSYEQYAGAKAAVASHNQEITEQIQAEIETRNSGYEAIDSVRQLNQFVRSNPLVPLQVKDHVGGSLEHIQKLLFNQQSLLSDVADRLNSYRVADTLPSLGIITSAQASAQRPPPPSNTFRMIIVSIAFALLGLLFVAATLAVFLSPNKSTARFAMDLLKVEVGFLSGLVSTFVVAGNT